MMIEVRRDSKTLLIQFAPCIGAQQNSKQTSIYFFIIGEVLPTNDRSDNNGTFIAVWRNNDSITPPQYANTSQPISCDYF
ncbi:unnamed protein product [Adineta ricciae]|uniref:Uncharacterized protein n=1 Tax=Adineta ricciae TaxID=249248 RepID=A0A815T0X0_ADIRI|nr:unnamed protein product [Adineta ricciae]CAF1499102.1 unnamed protein product [Adineta ricciae]